MTATQAMVGALWAVSMFAIASACLRIGAALVAAEGESVDSSESIVDP